MPPTDAARLAAIREQPPRTVIRQTSFEAIQHFADQAAPERVKVIDHPGTHWWAIMDREAIVGCINITPVEDRLELKAAWVLPTARGKGLGTAATEAVMTIALAEGRIVDAYVLNPTWYLARGFVLVGYNEHGIAFVRHEHTDLEAALVASRRETEEAKERVAEGKRIGQGFERDYRNTFEQSCKNLERARTAEAQRDQLDARLRALQKATGAGEAPFKGRPKEST